MKKEIKNPMNLHFRRIKHIHFVGIGGAGMCGIAEVLFNLGYMVSGSDIASSKTTDHLTDLGVRIFIGHQAAHIAMADVVVVSSAIEFSNPEVEAARVKHLPIVPRAVMLAELMRYRYGIAIAGCHGKTTTTSLIASVLGHAGLDPTFIVGGILKSCQFNSRLGTSKYMVVEADESDASFLHLLPMISVVTNIDQDHMGTYNYDLSKLKQTYIEFLRNLPFYGLAVICLDDPVAKEIIPDIGRPVLTYGFDSEADYRASEVKQIGMQMHFLVHLPENSPNRKQLTTEAMEQGIRIELNLVGRHNVLNALAAIAVADELEVAVPDIQNALTEFKGVSRRFDIKKTFYIDKSQPASPIYSTQPLTGELLETATQAEPIILVDDYGHHPKEIESVVHAARQSWPQKRLIMLFQPHRYTRTRDLYDSFVNILAEIDILILLDIYPANEQPLPGISSQALAASIRQRANRDPIYLANPNQLPALLNKLLQAGDILITQGAGNIGAIANDLSKNFS